MRTFFSFRHFPTIMLPVTTKKRESVASKPPTHSQWPDFGLCHYKRTANSRQCWTMRTLHLFIFILKQIMKFLIFWFYLNFQRHIKVDGCLGDGIAYILGEKRHATSATVFLQIKASSFVVPSSSHSIERPGGRFLNFRHRRQSFNACLSVREDF